MKNQSALVRAGACLLLAVSAAHVHAQQPADPQAAVPATSYRSALGTRPEAAPATTPDQNWVASNQTVASRNSMSLTMKPMAGQAGHGGHGGHGQVADPHAGHAMPGMNMGKQDSADMCTPGDKGSGKSADGKMSCCQPCCCKDKMGKMGKMDKPKEAS